MKITKQRLKEIIKEELGTVSEASDWREEHDAEMNGPATKGLQLKTAAQLRAVTATLRAMREEDAQFHASLLDILENLTRERE